MYATSARWEQHIRKGPSPISKVDVTFPGQGIVFADLPIIDGSITVSRGATTRSSGSLTIGDPDLLPALNSGSPIAPYGAELIVKTGFRYYDGTEELIPMGYFQIWDTTGSEASGNIPTIEVYDRSKAIENTDYITAKDYGGWPLQSALEDVALYAAPLYPGTGVDWSVTFGPGLTNPTLPGGKILNGNRWTFITELADSIGAEAYFDRNGTLQVVKKPKLTASTPVTSAVFEINVGANGVLIDADHPLSRNSIYNGVVVRGAAVENAPQPYGLVTDTNVNSRTYYGGPFGKRVLAIDDDSLTTNAQCIERATAELYNITGVQAAISFKALANPALDPGDYILASYLDGSQELHMLDEYRYDLSSAAMDGKTRSLQYVIA